MYGTNFMTGRSFASSADRLSLLKQVSERIDAIAQGIRTLTADPLDAAMVPKTPAVPPPATAPQEVQAPATAPTMQPAPAPAPATSASPQKPPFQASNGGGPTLPLPQTGLQQAAAQMSGPQAAPVEAPGKGNIREMKEFLDETILYLVNKKDRNAVMAQVEAAKAAFIGYNKTRAVAQWTRLRFFAPKDEPEAVNFLNKFRAANQALTEMKRQGTVKVLSKQQFRILDAYSKSVDELNVRFTTQRVKDEKAFKDTLVVLPYDNDLFQEMVRRYIDLQKMMNGMNIKLNSVGQPGSADIAAAQFSDELPKGEILKQMTDFPDRMDRYVLMNENDRKDATEAAQAIDKAIEDYNTAVKTGDVYATYFNLGKFRVARQTLIDMKRQDKLDILTDFQYRILKRYIDTVKDLAKNKVTLINLTNSSIKAEPEVLEQRIEKEKAFRKRVEEFPVHQDLFREMLRKYIDLVKFINEAEIKTIEQFSVDDIERAALRTRDEMSYSEILEQMQNWPRSVERYFLKDEADIPIVDNATAVIDESIKEYVKAGNAGDDDRKFESSDKFRDALQVLIDMNRKGKFGELNDQKYKILQEYIGSVKYLVENQAKLINEKYVDGERLEEEKAFVGQIDSLFPTGDSIQKMVGRFDELKKLMEKVPGSSVLDFIRRSFKRR